MYGRLSLGQNLVKILEKRGKGEYFMSFEIITDSAANLNKENIEKGNVKVIELPFFINGEKSSLTNLDEFNDEEFYSALKNGQSIKTSQINPQSYVEFMRPILEEGKDILFIGLSSGVSGSFNSALIAKEELQEEFPQRQIEMVDSLGAALGIGLLVLRAVKCRKNEMTLSETAERVISIRDKMQQIFIVDDLMYLKRTGRLSNLAAAVGFVLGIKPILRGSREGKIEVFEKIRGRKQAIKSLADKYIELAKNHINQTIGITHTGCFEDAKYLAKLISDKVKVKEILILKHEPATGSHLGPGALALFFEGDKVRA